MIIRYNSFNLIIAINKRRWNQNIYLDSKIWINFSLHAKFFANNLFISIYLDNITHTILWSTSIACSLSRTVYSRMGNIRTPNRIWLFIYKCKQIYKNLSSWYKICTNGVIRKFIFKWSKIIYPLFRYKKFFFYYYIMTIYDIFLPIFLSSFSLWINSLILNISKIFQ